MLINNYWKFLKTFLNFNTINFYAEGSPLTPTTVWTGRSARRSTKTDKHFKRVLSVTYYNAPWVTHTRYNVTTRRSFISVDVTRLRSSGAILRAIANDYAHVGIVAVSRVNNATDLPRTPSRQRKSVGKHNILNVKPPRLVSITCMSFFLFFFKTVKTWKHYRVRRHRCQTKIKFGTRRARIDERLISKSYDFFHTTIRDFQSRVPKRLVASVDLCHNSFSVIIYSLDLFVNPLHYYSVTP